MRKRIARLLMKRSAWREVDGTSSSFGGLWMALKEVDKTPRLFLPTSACCFH